MMTMPWMHTWQRCKLLKSQIPQASHTCHCIFVLYWQSFGFVSASIYLVEVVWLIDRVSDWASEWASEWKNKDNYQELIWLTMYSCPGFVLELIVMVPKAATTVSLLQSLYSDSTLVQQLLETSWGGTIWNGRRRRWRRGRARCIGIKHFQQCKKWLLSTA